MPTSSLCIAAQAGGRNLFVKPKSTASAANTVAVVTDRRSHSFRFVVLDNQCTGGPDYTGEANPSGNPLSSPDCETGYASAAAFLQDVKKLMEGFKLPE